MAEHFFIGETAVVVMRVLGVDPVTGEREPVTAAQTCVIRFKDPEGEVLEEKALGSGVTNAGDGYYWASAIPEVEGLHEVEMEVGADGGDQGRERITFAVSPF